MVFRKILNLLFIIFIISKCDSDINQTVIEQIKQQLIRKDDIFAGRIPQYTVNGRWIFSQKADWLAGFIGGELWYLYEMTGDEELKKRALAHADQVLQYSNIDYTHDMGFIFLPTCVKAYQVTGEQKYRQAAIQAAEMLAKRFNNRGNFIRAWGKLGTSKREGWMIIDTMMNLELLFWAAEETGNKKYYDIAYNHALTSMKQNIRPNYSSYHLVEFNPSTGEVLKKITHQGYRNESTWARGQAWGIYGFANAYRRTGDERFLKTAIGMADYFLSSLPEDYVPYWDLDLSGEDVLRDASAAAIAASAMFLLADQLKEQVLSQKYLDNAIKITNSLIKNYLFTKSNREQEQGILIHTLYNYRNQWGIDESYPAGDYYFIEAVKKLWVRKATNYAVK